MTIAESAVIHATAIIEDGAEIAADVSIGPYSVVGANARLGEAVRLDSHVVVSGHTTVGARSRIFPFSSVGSEPQDLKFGGEITSLEVGEDTVIREHVTMNPGTEGGGGVTRIGDKCLFMAGTHVAHDCHVGSNVIFAKGAGLAGHVEVGDHAIIGGHSAIHQFVRIGPHAMVGGMTGVERDVIPAGTVIGNRAHLAGLNLTGLKRRGYEKADINQLRAVYREIFQGGEGELAERATRAQADLPETGLARDMVDFILARSSRHFCIPLSA